MRMDKFCLKFTTRRGSSKVRAYISVRMGNYGKKRENKDGRQDGLWKYYFDNGQLKSEGVFDEGGQV